MDREELIKMGNMISNKYLLPKQHLQITSRQVNYWKEWLFETYKNVNSFSETEIAETNTFENSFDSDSDIPF